jgi:hypothetical protein
MPGVEQVSLKGATCPCHSQIFERSVSATQRLAIQTPVGIEIAVQPVYTVHCQFQHWFLCSRAGRADGNDINQRFFLL